MSPRALVRATSTTLGLGAAASLLAIAIPTHSAVANPRADAPVVIANVHGTPDSPILIEGFDVVPSMANGISIVNSSYVIIRGNTIRGATGSLDSPLSGTAIYVQDSSHIQIVGNTVADNLRGISVSSTPGSPKLTDIAILDNVVTGSVADAGILVRGAEGLEIANNVLDRNGEVTVFDRHRITGIIAWDSSNISIHDNRVTRSSSDGVGVATSREVLESGSGFRSHDVEVFDNYSAFNGEQGIWLSVIRGGSAHGNVVVRNSNDDPALGSSGIRLEAGITNFKVYANQLIRNEVAEVKISASASVEVYDNVMTPGNLGILIDSERDAFLPDVKTTKNLVHNNIISGGGATAAVLVVDATKTRVVNNTIYDLPIDGIVLGPSSRGTLVANNIMTKIRGRALVNQGVGSVAGPNLYFHNGRNVIGIRSDPKDIFGNPRFVAPGTGDFALRPGSPAKAAGARSVTYCAAYGRERRPDLGAVCIRAD